MYEKFNLEDYGQCVSEQYTIVNNNDAEYFEYTSSEIIKTKYTEGPINISFSKDERFGYSAEITAFEKDTNKQLQFSIMRSMEIFQLHNILDYIDKSYCVQYLDGSAYDLEGKTYNYDNAVNKTENDYVVSMTKEGSEITVDICIDKNSTAIMHNNVLYVADGDKCASMFIMYSNNKGYRNIDASHNNLKVTVYEYDKDTLFFTEFNNANYKSGVYNLTNNPTVMHIDDNKYNIEYTEDGLFKSMKSDSDEVLGYVEDIYDESGKDFSSSLHRMILDGYNLYSYNDKDLYCLDSIDYNGADDGNIIFRRSIYRIDKDKIEKLNNIISDLNKNKPDYPVL